MTVKKKLNKEDYQIYLKQEQLKLLSRIVDQLELLNNNLAIISNQLNTEEQNEGAEAINDYLQKAYEEN